MAAWSGWAPQQKGLIVDGFAGPGGWSEGIRRWLGLHDVGLEWDEAACQTRAAAGHLTVRVDVSCFVLGPLVGRVWGLLMSPPCTKFSTAGNGLGRKFIAVLADGIRRVMRGEDCRQEMRDRIYPAALAAREAANAAREEGKRWSRERVEAAALEDTIATVLVLEPARFLYALVCGRPDGVGMPLEWAAFEQVPSVLPLWEVYAEELRRLGWSVWTGVLNAANYGVPQTRERAVLMASSVRKVAPPEPTHAKVSEPDLFGPGLPEWVSMAEALGLDGDETVNTRGDRKTPGGNEFSTGRPSWALTEKARSWTLHTNRDQRADGSRQTIDPHSAPAPALTSKSGGQWYLRNNTQANAAMRIVDEPAGTLFFGHRGKAVNWTDGEEKRALTQAEGAVLQSFPDDYPWQGTKTKQFEQIGNAVPPLLAAHAVSAASGVPFLQEVLIRAA
ncbi:DNA cytosine methyltransferase [Streptomyces chartreusis]|uniref:DNA cytosine methyltransferase n=1 Tax=Streptomyces chartreusis TaxID=1969 RepID=UPI0037DC3150|nr:DNA cytosine methyltransferase [Streptomyces chartreusis]